jgi:hypothetical protein
MCADLALHSTGRPVPAHLQDWQECGWCKGGREGQEQTYPAEVEGHHVRPSTLQQMQSHSLVFNIHW